MSRERPALLGGSPIRPGGPPSWPLADDDVHAALEAAFRNGSWGRYHGGNVELLEQHLRDYFQVEHVLTCASGTVAVELALRALRVNAGDEVIVSAYDYPGNFLSVHAVNAVPVLVDIEADAWQLSSSQLAGAVSDRCRAMIVSHLHGGQADMAAALAFARDHGLSVIEDAAQAPGAIVAGKKAGTWGDAGILSFGGSKLLTAGRGGALITSRPDVFQRAKTFMQRGNRTCPLAELQAAVLVPQMKKLDDRNRLRAENGRRLLAALAGISGLKPLCRLAAESAPALYKLGFQYDASVFGLSRARFVDAMRAEGIAIDEGFAAGHVGRSPRRFRQVGTLAEATRAHEACVILHHPVLLEGPAGVDQVAAAVRKIWDFREELACAGKL
ncbi:MAG: aminotransferase class V-fold PLP-dependent enzyme [Planctomycetes bacterium]|nr:aminotransferase class V-fold PLP-dependent enzyme [Planctomycetota bacterium]